MKTNHITRRKAAPSQMVVTIFSVAEIAVGCTSGAQTTPQTPVLVIKDQGSSFKSTDVMHTPRSFHTATLLPDGKVLITGGWNSEGAIKISECFDPEGNQGYGSFINTSTSMVTPRFHHTATWLPNGKVLITGGWNADDPLRSAEQFDPSRGSFTPIACLMTTFRSNHSATLLYNGKVLIAGGLNGDGTIGCAELFDPSTGSFSAIACLMTTPRSDHTATRLPNGKVLLTGGMNENGYINSAELFDPDGNDGGGSFTAVPDLMSTPKYGHSATQLPNGNVLITGGSNGYAPISVVEQFDPEGNNGMGSITPLPHTLSLPRCYHTATLLADNRILMIGGQTNSVFCTNNAELLDPLSECHTTSFLLTKTPRRFHTATYLLDGRVLIAGGMQEDGYLDNAEVLDPKKPSR